MFAVVGQWWREVTFLHWPVDSAAVAGLLPEGTRPDTFDGVTYVGLVAFLLDPVRQVRIGTFRETNVRLYSVDDTGRRGVVFLSMDASALVPVLGARLSVRLPYRWAEMRLRRDNDVLTYTCRRGRDGPTSRIVVRTGEHVTPSPLDRFLTARWGLHTSWYGRTLYIPNEHPEWDLYQAEVLELDDELVAAAGVPVGGPPVSALFSPGVPARFGVPLR